MKESIETLRPLLVDGIPEFDIPSIEPLIIPEVIIDQGNGPVSVKSIYRDINVHGPSEFVIKNVRFDFDKDKVKVKIWFPWLQVNTNYSMDGRILMMPIKGSGLSYGNYTDIDATVSMKAQRLQKGNETFYNIKDFFVDFNIGKASLFFDNLFNGEPQLGEAMNLFLNDNWKSVSKEIKPVLEDTIAKIFKKFSNKIFHKYPIRVLFPE
ncbi:protein takeout-like isoform X2 [Cylas formicarius]|nr:protein takeout-like isoform X2 [Cylas formicarius]